MWWRCHRRIVNDYVLALSEEVFYLIGRNRIEPARMMEGAQVTPDLAVVYPVKRREDE